MSKTRIHPVFFDPNNKRWPRLRRGVFLTGLFFTVAFSALILSIIFNPILPKIIEDTSKPNYKTVKNIPSLPKPQPISVPDVRRTEIREAKQKIKEESAARKAALKNIQNQPHNADDPLSVAFYVNWDESSGSSLREGIEKRGAQLDILIMECLHLEDANGQLTENNKDDDNTVAVHQKIKETLDFMRTRSPRSRVTALVNNAQNNQWYKEKLTTVLANPDTRKRVIDQLFDYVESNKFDGVSIDFESLDPVSKDNLLQFMAELSSRFRPAGLEISINVPVDDPTFDYRKLAELSDYEILMAYDQHDSTGSEDGAIAGLDWFENILRKHQADIPPEKTIVAIGNYGYDWTVEDKNGKKLKKEAETLTFEDAVLRAVESSDLESSDPDDIVSVQMDPASLNPYFEFADDDDNVHKVWFLDALTAFNQMVVARNYSSRGFALWRLGSEDPSLWSFFGKAKPLDQNLAQSLSKFTYGYNLDYEGKGEILKIREEPRDGERAITFDEKRGLITQQSYTQFPSPWVIDRWGGKNYKIALTFDDGPDTQYTPQILDILKEHQVHATFFIMGLNGELTPELLKREYEEGHDIGSHTFTHPNVAAVSETQFKLELAATDVLLESIIGHRTTLFRPPYAEDAEPTTPDETKPLKFINDRGYIDVGMKIDPNDWKQPGTTTQQIVDSTIEQINSLAKTGEGNIVLLHDSGGDRRRTIEALPQIFEKIKEINEANEIKGLPKFEFVSVSELMGKSRDEIMPPVPPDEMWRMVPTRMAFAVINFTSFTLHYLFLAGIILGIARLLFIGALAVIEHWKERHAVYDDHFKPDVAVIVPAYNEEKVIVQTIASLLASDLPDFEIVVVDDGSSDNTTERVREAFADEPRVRLFTKANAGKPEALNYGVLHTKADIVIALDADTVFAKDTISKLARHFADQKIGAVAGNAKVGNRINLLTRWQALEYVTSQNLDRRAFNVLNCITVVPGAVGAWRRELVLEAGGFTHLTLAEDADLTMAIRKQGYRVAYEDEAIGLTEAPDTVRGFIKQRYRWMYGTLQAAWKHKNALFNPRYGSLGFVALPNIFIFQVLFPLVSPAMDLLMLLSLANVLWTRFQHPADFSADTFWRVMFFYALFVGIDFVAAALAFALEKTENKRLLVWLFLQRFFYRQLMYYVAIKATFASVRGIAVGWNKLERKATVKT
jgi:cellulose synthase/poly-beta-1,6-N-acetylglucosamine synthase-like glycosyltransferase/spore germination protein YaaH/peptidoglycan/xylan/chitin deacetylase (PgdA/CDA1 family)